MQLNNTEYLYWILISRINIAIFELVKMPIKYQQKLPECLVLISFQRQIERQRKEREEKKKMCTIHSWFSFNMNCQHFTYNIIVNIYAFLLLTRVSNKNIILEIYFIFPIYNNKNLT